MPCWERMVSIVDFSSDNERCANELAAEAGVSIQYILSDVLQMPAARYSCGTGLGEIVTSIAAKGLYVKSLEELPNLSSDVFDKGIPKSYIIVADKL